MLADLTTKVTDEVKAGFFDRDQELLAKATTSSPEQFARHCRSVIARLERDQGIERNKQQRRDTYLSISVQRDGMHRINGLLHPELGAAIFTAVDKQVATMLADNRDGLDRSQLAAQALGNLVSGGHQAQRPLEAEILLLCDHTTITHGLHDHSVCETDTGAILPPETIRRLCCNGRIVPILLLDGVPVNVGREQRLANRAQRRALRAMYPTCGFAGARPRSTAAKSTSCRGRSAASPTWQTCCRYAPVITISYTNSVGDSSSPPTGCSRSDNPTARSSPPNRSRSDQPNAATANSTTKPNAPDNA